MRTRGSKRVPWRARCLPNDGAPTTARSTRSCPLPRRRVPESGTCRSRGRESDGTRVVEEMARRLRPAGFVTIDASLEIPCPLRAELTHRHLAVHFRSEADRAPVVRWIRHLADVSPRAHVIVELTRGAAAGRSPGLRTRARRFTRGAFGDHVMSATSWNWRVSTAVRQAHAHMATSRPDLAESLLASVSAEAMVRGERLPRAIFANSHLEELIDATCSSHSHVAAAGARR